LRAGGELSGDVFTINTPPGPTHSRRSEKAKGLSSCQWFRIGLPISALSNESTLWLAARCS
jgi:hypothetical protein